MNAASALLLLATLAGGCNSADRTCEREIRATVAAGSGYLAQTMALYGVVYTGQSTRFFGTRKQFYVREDSAQVYYGYPLQQALIRVDDDTLYVRVPRPAPVAVHRVVRSIHKSDDGYNPGAATEKTDADAPPPGDVDAAIQRNLEQAIERNKASSETIAMEFTRAYFAAIAGSYGLNLDIDFEDADSSDLPARRARPLRRLLADLLEG